MQVFLTTPQKMGKNTPPQKWRIPVGSHGCLGGKDKDLLDLRCASFSRWWPYPVNFGASANAQQRKKGPVLLFDEILPSYVEI